MQGATVYCVSQTEQENIVLKRRLDSLQSSFPALSFVSLRPEGLPYADLKKVSIVIINVREWTQEDSSLIEKLRADGFHRPMVVVARAGVTQAQRQLASRLGVIFIGRNTDPKDFVGVVEKLLRLRMVTQQLHPRYKTQERIEVRPKTRSEFVDSRMANLSKGGAHIQFSEGTMVCKGDVVEMKIELKEMNRTYTVDARVVWTADQASAGAAFSAGVVFLGVPNVKRGSEFEFDFDC